MLAAARAAPGNLTYGTAGVGSIGHLVTEMFSAAAKIRMRHVPYKGAAIAAIDLAGGQIQVMVSSFSTLSPFLKADKVRGLDVAGFERATSAVEPFEDRERIGEVAPALADHRDLEARAVVEELLRHDEPPGSRRGRRDVDHLVGEPELGERELGSDRVRADPVPEQRDRFDDRDGHANRTSQPVPASYASVNYWGVHGFTFTNGIQASYVEVDPDTGFVKLLKHWCVEDCGTVINPMLVDEQIRGGIVQGIGGALFEECLYSDEGQLLNGSMADYLVPMASEMPDIIVDHVETPTRGSELGAKGAGEAGTAGAPGAVMNAINDALRPLGAKPLTDMPFAPDKILRALGQV